MTDAAEDSKIIDGIDELLDQDDITNKVDITFKLSFVNKILKLIGEELPFVKSNALINEIHQLALPQIKVFEDALLERQTLETKKEFDEKFPVEIPSGSIESNIEIQTSFTDKDGKPLDSQGNPI